jgi:hypothetical protein
VKKINWWFKCGFVEIKPAQLPATNNDIEDELPFNDNTNNSI